MSVQDNSQTLVNTTLRALQSRGLTRARVFDFATLLSGQVGRLVFSVVYFVVLARALSLGDFGIFATCSAIGIVLSRLLGFGFVSPLFRVATTRPSLIGAYTAGFILASIASLPLLFGAAWGLHALLYSNLIPVETFFFIIMAEVICWRGIETVIIVCHGQNRYSAGSALGISAGAVKAVAASAFLLNGQTSLQLWGPIYFYSLLTVLLISTIVFYPKQRLRWKPRAWMGRMRDAVGVSAAEALFYLQSEMDKVLVLALGGETLAGLYAIVLRLVDLTAVPLRALSTMLTQWIMRERQSGEQARTSLKLDAIIGLTSVMALIAMAVLLSFAPNILGKNIALGASYLWLVLLVPAFRNAIELHTDLLYGHQRMASRVLLLVYLGFLKASLIILLLGYTNDFAEVAIWLNALFGILYAASALVTYGRILTQPVDPTAKLNPE